VPANTYSTLNVALHVGKTLAQLIIQFPDTKRHFAARTVKLKAVSRTPRLHKAALQLRTPKQQRSQKKPDQQITP